MRITKVPTGDIMVMDGDLGKLECLSLADYGKEKNVKADFLGLSRDLGRVQHTDLLPLSKKWVITMSTQYGCSMGCRFCDVPKVGPGRNVTLNDLYNQLFAGLSRSPETHKGDRLNIHFARMGEPTFNKEVLGFATNIAFKSDSSALRDRFSTIHPVVSTMMPKDHEDLLWFLRSWCSLKNEIYGGEAGLQLSINTTSAKVREKTMPMALGLAAIGCIVGQLPEPKGRKYTLNFAVTDAPIDPGVLLNYFDPAKFIVKLTPMHKTRAATQNGLETAGEYTEYAPYKHHEEVLRKAGYDVLVFVASSEEDSSGITCGNALLASRQGA